MVCSSLCGISSVLLKSFEHSRKKEEKVPKKKKKSADNVFYTTTLVVVKHIGAILIKYDIDVNDMLRAFRIVAQLRQSDVAKILGIHQSAYSRKERGEQPFYYYEVEALFDYYADYQPLCDENIKASKLIRRINELKTLDKII